MTEPEPLSNSERSDTTGSWEPEIPTGSETPKPLDPPTVRSLNSGSSSELIARASAAPSLPMPRPGDQVDSFELQESIGVGGMGAVFRARDARLDRLVALKILPPEQSNDSEAVQRFYQEGRAAARLDHENIARVFTIGYDSHYHYIAFEFIEGTTIRQQVTERSGPLSITEAINYTLQIADALVHARERGVVHRDIKPSNIIITPLGRAKLVDMGLARRFESGVDDGLTQSGTTLGTFDYISPEQARDPRSVDVRSDLYSLGCTLFYMLAGHPPFPDGTVLQKLLQHQEEAPPDLRDINPQVTKELSAIVLKLMAKDRDRRYQTPEQLARDLLTVAGSMQLRSLSPEGLVWMAPTARVQPAWERHLIWEIPTLAFITIVGYLIWSGQDFGRVGEVATNGPTTIGRSVAPPKDSRPGSLIAAADRASNEPESDAPQIVPEFKEPSSDDETLGRTFPEELQPKGAARAISVDSTEDLLAVIQRSPRRATLVLTDAGPYRIRGSFGESESANSRLIRRELTIKAEQGVRPVIQFQSATATPRGALFDFSGGIVVIEGIEFSLEGSAVGSVNTPPAAIRAEDTDLTLRRCLFRRAAGATNPAMIDPRTSAILVENTKTKSAEGDRPAPLVLDRCHFDPEQVGILATGPLDLLERDCTIAAQPAVWLDATETDRLVPSDLTFRHVSFLAGSTSVFRFNGSATRVRIDDCVIAPMAGTTATVVAESHPEALRWQGRGNLYAGIATFLLPIGNSPGQATVRDSAEWTESGETIRERGPKYFNRSIWDESRHEGARRSGRSPAITFRLDPEIAKSSDVGARDSLTEPLAMADQLLASRERANRNQLQDDGTSKARNDAIPNTEVPPLTVDQPSLPKSNPASNPDSSAIAANDNAVPKLNGPPTPIPIPMPVAVGEEPISDMPIMPLTGSEEKLATNVKGAENPSDGTTRGDLARPNIKPPAESSAKPSAATVANPEIPPPINDDSTTLRSVDQLRKALSEPGAKGGVLRVAPDADWELSETVVSVQGSWRIQAISGASRPKLRFAPTANAAVENPNSPWRSMIDLRAGSLHLDGFDIVLPRSNAPANGGWGAFSTAVSTELGLSNCSVTVEGDQLTSAVVAFSNPSSSKAIVSSPVDEKNANPQAASATVRIQDSLVRCGGDLFLAPGGTSLVLDLDNTLISSSGSLLHARGYRRAEPTESITMTLRSVTSRNLSGLVFLESSADDPNLPIAKVNVRDSILTTTQGGPLLRVEGQGSLSALRDQIVWEGLRVGYHQISIYRRDQSNQLGTVPNQFDRQSWMVAVGSREINAVHGDMMFHHPWDNSRPAWEFRAEDAEVDPESPASSSGPILARVPQPNARQ